jgi:hypothetical protein
MQAIKLARARNSLKSYMETIDAGTDNSAPWFLARYEQQKKLKEALKILESRMQ